MSARALTAANRSFRKRARGCSRDGRLKEVNQTTTNSFKTKGGMAAKEENDQPLWIELGRIDLRCRALFFTGASTPEEFNAACEPLHVFRSAWPTFAAA